MRIDQISIFTLQKFQKHCVGKGLNATTSNRILATYRRMARSLFAWRIIPTPFPMVKLEKERNQRTYVLSAEEENRLITAAKADGDPYIWLFIRIGIATSLRHSEILSLSFKNFDLERRRIRVRVKGGRWRDQPLTRTITELLAHERSMSEDSYGWVFPSARSLSGHLGQMGHSFARCVKIAGMDPSVVTPHTMRHTAITRLAATGADIKTIQEFSGHESIEMVLRYAHAQDHVVDRALEKLEAGTLVELPNLSKAEGS